ncbi:MAG: TonB-dependent siderophore receptor [Neisseria sp.]|nr:TonB-dependent siderophore receptor [Neisseria sp.]
MNINKPLALLPLLVCQAWVYAEDMPHQIDIKPVEIRAKSVKAFSEATDAHLRDGANLGLLGYRNTFTAPINVVRYDEKAFSDKAPRNIVDVIAKTDSSTMNFGGETNTISGLYVRNLQIDARQFSVNGLAGLYSTYNSPAAAVASAQLIKGASTAVVGMDAEGASGASVNIETKRAGDEPAYIVGLGWFGAGRMQPSFDIGRRFGSNKEWGVRINGVFRKGDMPRKDSTENNKELAVGADYRGEKLKIGTDLMYTKRATEGGRARIQDMQTLWTVENGFTMPAAPKGNVNLIPRWSAQTTEDKTAMATFEYAADHGITYSGGLGYMESAYQGSFTQLAAMVPGEKYRTSGNCASGSGAKFTYTAKEGDYCGAASRAIDYVSRTSSATLKARGHFDTGAVSHQWSAAFDYVKRHRDFHRSIPAASSRFISNLYAPEFPAAPVFGPLSDQNVHETFAAPSLAVADTMSFSDGKLRLTIGGRLQYVQQTNHESSSNKQENSVSKRAISPLLTAVWQPEPNTVVYGNYMRDLEPGKMIDNEDAVNNGQTLAPAKTSQVEIGVRKNWNGGLLTTSAAVYRIFRPSAYLNSEKVFGYGGRERNSGLELNVYANLLNKTLRPSLGISFLRAELRDFKAFNSDAIYNGTQQVTSPRIIAKAGVEWETPFVKGLTLNAYAQHYGKSYINAANTSGLPSYTTADIGAKYQIPVGKGRLTVRSAVENVFNKAYWQVQRGRYDRSFAVLGMPRTFWLKADYAF